MVAQQTMVIVAIILLSVMILSMASLATFLAIRRRQKRKATCKDLQRIKQNQPKFTMVNPFENSEALCSQQTLATMLPRDVEKGKDSMSDFEDSSSIDLPGTPVPYRSQSPVSRQVPSPPASPPAPSAAAPRTKFAYTHQPPSLQHFTHKDSSTVNSSSTSLSTFNNVGIQVANSEPSPFNIVYESDSESEPEPASPETQSSKSRSVRRVRVKIPMHEELVYNVADQVSPFADPDENSINNGSIQSLARFQKVPPPIAIPYPTPCHSPRVHSPVVSSPVISSPAVNRKSSSALPATISSSSVSIAASNSKYDLTLDLLTDYYHS